MPVEENISTALSQIIPLHLVAGTVSPYGYLMAKALLEKGSDPNYRDPDGLTPVHVAASWGNYETLKLLLLNGGDPWLKDVDGNTPSDLAEQENRVECVRLLSWWSQNSKSDSKPSTPINQLARNTKADSKPSTPTTSNRLSGNRFPTQRQQQQSPTTLEFSSPTTTPTAYKPKYFSSPLRDSPTSPFSPSSGGGNRRTPATSENLRRSINYATCRALRYESDKNRSNRDECVDGNIFDKCEKSLEELNLDKSISVKDDSIDEIKDNGGEIGDDFEIEERQGILEKGENRSLQKEEKRSPEKEMAPSPKKEIEKQRSPKKEEKENRSPKSANISAISANDENGQFDQAILDNNSIDNLSFLNDGLISFSQQLNETLKLDEKGKRRALALLEETILEENREIDPRRLSQCNKLTDSELRRQAIDQGMDVGPITMATRFLYVRRLASLLGEPKIGGGAVKKYSSELQAAIDGRLDEAGCLRDEKSLRLSFDKPLNGVARQWREGCLKHSFCYLLLDPSVTQDLPTRSLNMSESECFQTFVDAIFYIGKGKKSRPLQHLLEAANLDVDLVSKNVKLERILSLWRQGHGVISLHVFQNIIPAEAYAREAAMIDSIGISRLCNLKRGDYYGAAANWNLGRRRRYGAYLLKKAFSIFLLEGEKQLKRDDVLKPSSA